ncbi:flavin-nucleotide-binding protein [Teratosphaeria destructans]|uniref:Flavin-nucleotide-binding protein n=1 Tax=Teratosphaeria destructans TaxID=418781 RepID=A0A9W7T1E7_9PEZI|nr:flavin-nucleotide-binding protein [Teratosphaeria destructans]
MDPSETTAYTPDERSKGNRLAKQTTYDHDLIHTIINEAPILHVAFNAPYTSPSPFPTILPMLGAVGHFPASSKEPSSIYLHGSSVARLFRLTAENDHQPLPLTISATILDGYVLALAPFHNTCNYRSAVAFGTGTLVTSPEEIEYGLRLITNIAMPYRWETSRSPATQAEIRATGLLKVGIDTASAKVRRGGPSDERADLRNPDVVGRTWVGVLPTYMVLGEPVQAEHNRVERVPEYLLDWVADVNGGNEQRAVNAFEG